MIIIIIYIVAKWQLQLHVQDKNNDMYHEFKQDLYIKCIHFVQCLREIN